MAVVFSDSCSFEMLSNIEAFCVKKGLLLRNNQSWEFVFLFVLQQSEGLSCRNIYGETFYNTFCIEYANKVTLRRKY